jgi:FkbM family methyltransferase
MKREDHVFMSAVPRSATFYGTYLAILNRLLHRIALRNIRKGAPPLAIFAFDHISQQITLNGKYERQELETFFAWAEYRGYNFLKDTAIDVGANIGNHALFFSDYFRKIICFEANPRTSTILSLNSMLKSNIEVHNIGLSDYIGSASLYSLPINIGGATILGVDGKHPVGAELIDIKLNKLDDVVDDNQIGLIKIDVEGHELAVIKGGRNIIFNQKPLILFEHIVSDSSSDSGVVQLLQEYGYSNFFAIKKSPDSQFSNRYLRFFSNFVTRIIQGEKNKVIKVNDFKRTYTFLIATP